jgi:hypothetical protein
VRYVDVAVALGILTGACANGEQRTREQPTVPSASTLPGTAVERPEEAPVEEAPTEAAGTTDGPLAAPTGRVAPGDSTRARIAMGETAPLPGSNLSATVLDLGTGHRIDAEGRRVGYARAQIRFEADDGRSETVSWGPEMSQTATVLGYRLYASIMRSEVTLWVLPAAPE